MSINSNDNKVRCKMAFYFIHTFLSVIILINRSKQKIKKKKNEFLKNYIKNRTYYYFNGIIKIENFNFDDILLDKKSCKTF